MVGLVLMYMLAFQKKGTSPGLIMNALCLYFLGPSFRSTAETLDAFIEKRSQLPYEWGTTIQTKRTVSEEN